MALDPRLRALYWLGGKLGDKAYETMPAHLARRAFANEVSSLEPLLFGRGPVMAEERVLMLDPTGIRALLHRPRLSRTKTPDPRPLPIIVFFHGGGWVVGSPETHASLCRRLAVAARALVLSIDYRLAPEHPFPAAIDDAYVATKWARDHAAEIGGDAARIAVCGDSAGANLAAAVSIRAREELGPKPVAQGLIYPVTDANFETPSYLQCATGYGLTRSRMQWYWEQYEKDPARRVHPLASPARAPSLRDLPPATVITAEYDVLRDEGDAFAHALYEAGNDVAHRRVEGVTHGYIMMDRTLRAASESVAFIGDRFRAAFATART